MSRDFSMMDVLGMILSRLVNVALFIVIAILTLLFIRSNTDMHMGVIALLSVVAGVLGTFLVRLLLRGVVALGSTFQ